jgi:lysozyme
VLIGAGAGCGASATTTIVTPVAPAPSVTYLPPQSSITPEGARPASPPRSLSESVGGKHVSVRGLHLIEGFEGYESCPYWDPYGRIWTRGYGETEGIGQHSACISRAYGEANLRSRLERFYEWSLRGLGVQLNQNEWDALDSFVWNLGAGIFTGTLRADLHARQFYAAGRIMLLYDHAGGQVLEGLRTRREAEVRLLLTPEPAVNHAALEARQRTLIRVLRRYGCGERRHRHQHVGPRCARWFREGDQVHGQLRLA